MKPVERELHILYVDDEADIRCIVDIALGDEDGLRLTLCDSGASAVAAAAGDTPDLILLDVMMPGMDGPGTLRQLRDQPRLAKVPVAFVTARVQPHEIAQLMSLGAAGVIGKPFDPLALPDQVRSLCEGVVSG